MPNEDPSRPQFRAALTQIHAMIWLRFTLSQMTQWLTEHDGHQTLDGRENWTQSDLANAFSYGARWLFHTEPREH